MSEQETTDPEEPTLAEETPPAESPPAIEVEPSSKEEPASEEENLPVKSPSVIPEELATEEEHTTAGSVSSAEQKPEEDAPVVISEDEEMKEETKPDNVDILDQDETAVEEQETAVAVEQGEGEKKDEPLHADEVAETEEVDLIKEGEKLEEEIEKAEDEKTRGADGEKTEDAGGEKLGDEDEKKTLDADEQSEPADDAADHEVKPEDLMQIDNFLSKMTIIDDQLSYDLSATYRHGFDEVSNISLHGGELPEIRGLKELETMESRDKIKEIPSDDLIFSKRMSMRMSLANRMISEAEHHHTSDQKVKERPDYLARLSMQVDSTYVLDEDSDNLLLPPREELYAHHEKLMSEIPFIRVKNKFLHRKLADHYKKRKMEHVFKEEIDDPTDAIQKYEKKLEKLESLFKVYNEETQKIEEELEVLQEEMETKYAERDTLFIKGMNRKKEIGTGLISTKTGKEIPDKVVEQLLRRQTNASTEISQLRLLYITKRNEFAEKTVELRSLDNIAGHLSLMDYEQLKIENRAHSDKLEEKEEELTKLRWKCRNAVQIMAHVREKSAALDADMEILKQEYDEVLSGYIEIRERLNFYKTERDELRKKTTKLKGESGLLTKPKLLLDMETSMEEAKIYEETLEKVKEEYNLKTQQMRNLRKNIAFELMMSKKLPKEKKKIASAKYFSVRPTLIIPKLPANIFNTLEDIIDESLKRKH